MLQVRQKSSIPAAIDVNRRTAEAGIPLSWDRYEEQLPLCGFTQNGLNCSACLQGPCRINPFGDAPSHGICGIDAAQMVLHSLVEKVRRGAIDHVNVWLSGVGEHEPAATLSSEKATAALASRLPAPVLAHLAERSLLPRDVVLDVVTAGDPFFVDRGMLEQTRSSLLRLGVCAIVSSLGVCQATSATARGRSEAPSPPSSDGVMILLDGVAPAGFVARLEASLASQDDVGLASTSQVHASGARFLVPGSPELAVASGLADFVIQSELGGYPSLGDLCDQMDIPHLTIASGDGWPDLADVLQRARAHHTRQARPLLDGGEAMESPADGWPADIGETVRTAVRQGAVRGVVLLVVGTNIRQTHFERTAGVVKGLLAHDVVVLLAADAVRAAHLLDDLPAAAGRVLQALMRGRSRPWFSAGSVFESARALEVFGPLAGAEGFGAAPVAATFLEIPSFAFLAAAIGWLGLGVSTQIGSPLPIWGSPSITRWMTDESRPWWGARLLASPELASPEEQVQQLVRELDARK